MGGLIKFEKWQCEECGFCWYEDPETNNGSHSNIEHGCPQGCDSAGVSLGIMEIHTEMIDCSKLKAPVYT